MSSGAQVIASDVAYQPFGGVKSYTLGNGQSATRGYDQDGRISSYGLGAQSFAIGYDNASRITSIDVNTYGYDALDRLTSATLPASSFAYGYDATGNRTSMSGDTYAYSSTSNRIASITPQAGGVRSFSFDANGSTTDDGINQYVYDARGRMVQSIGSLGTTTSQVNALGQRVRKTNTTDDRVFVYDTKGRLIEEANPAGQVLTEYLYLGDIPVAVSNTQGTYYVQVDHLNTPRFIADATGTTVWRWDQGEPFGNDVPNNNPSGLGAFDFPLRFPGQYFDRETGLLYNGYRYNSPDTGRYIQSDPIGLYGGLNTYTYVAGNPISAIDASGLCWSDVRAALHFFGGGGDVTVNEIGCETQISEVVQPERIIWKARTEAAAREKAASMQCGSIDTLDIKRSVGLQSGIFWIRGFSLLQQSGCLVSRSCGGLCGQDTYMFTCALASTMHDQYIYPSDWDKSGNTNHPDFWDKWNYGGTPFYVNGTWNDSVSGSGRL